MSFYHQLWDCLKKEKFVMRLETLLYKKILIKSAITILEHDPANETLKFKINFEIPGGTYDNIVYDSQGFGIDQRKGNVLDKIVAVSEVIDPVIAIDCEYRIFRQSNVPGTNPIDRKDIIRKYLIGTNVKDLDITPEDIFQDLNESLCGKILDSLENMEFDSIMYYESEKESAYLYSSDDQWWGSLKLKLLGINITTIQ